MFCPMCGAACEDGAKFCPGCGANLTISASEQPFVEQIEQPVFEQPVFDQSIYQQPMYPQPVYPYQQPIRKSGNGLGIASMILGILSLVMLFGPGVGGLLFVDIILAIVGLILGAVGMSKGKKVGASNDMAVAGLVCSIITLSYIVLAFMRVLLAASTMDAGF